MKSKLALQEITLKSQNLRRTMLGLNNCTRGRSPTSTKKYQRQQQRQIHTKSPQHSILLKFRARYFTNWSISKLHPGHDSSILNTHSLSISLDPNTQSFTVPPKTSVFNCNKCPHALFPHSNVLTYGIHMGKKFTAKRQNGWKTHLAM